MVKAIVTLARVSIAMLLNSTSFCILFFISGSHFIFFFPSLSFPALNTIRNPNISSKLIIIIMGMVGQRQKCSIENFLFLPSTQIPPIPLLVISFVGRVSGDAEISMTK